MMIRGKRGAEIAMNTIIIIIIAVLVLVFVAFAFTSTGRELLNRITGFGGGGINADDIVKNCNIACATNSVNDYCVTKKNFIYDKDDSGKLLSVSLTCQQLESSQINDSNNNVIANLPKVYLPTKCGIC